METDLHRRALRHSGDGVRHRRSRPLSFHMDSSAVAAGGSWRWRCRGVLPELAGDVFVDGVLAGEFEAMASMLSVYMAIHAVPIGLLDGGRLSEGARCDRTRRYCRGPGSRPGTRSLPSASLRFTHQVKLSMSFLGTHAQDNARSPFRAPFFQFVDPPRRPSMHGRTLHRRGPHSCMRGLVSVLGCWIPFAGRKHVVPWRNPDPRAQDAIRNARSRRAYQWAHAAAW